MGQARLPASGEGPWGRHRLERRVCDRRIDPGSEWRRPRRWIGPRARGDRLGADDARVPKKVLYRCLDQGLPHPRALLGQLTPRWPEGVPLAYEVLAGNPADQTTLKRGWQTIQAPDGRAERVGVRDRGIPPEEVRAQRRAAAPPVDYRVGTPRGRLTPRERDRLPWPWATVRLGVHVK